MRIPNFLQNLLGEGVLSASMIPVYARLLAEKDEQTAGRVAGVIASLLALVTASLVVIGVVFAPLLVDVLAAGFEGDLRLLTIRLVRILFPGIGLLVLSAWCLAVLNSHRMFFIPYVAPVIWNAAIIAAPTVGIASASAVRDTGRPGSTGGSVPSRPNSQTLSPRAEPMSALPAEYASTYCLPSCTNVLIGACMPAPV